MTDTLKIPRAAIQYSNQDQIRCHNIIRMNKFLVKSKTVDSLPSDDSNFETFTNDLQRTEADELTVRHVSRLILNNKIQKFKLVFILEQSTFSGKNLTAANLARLNKIHTNPPTKNIPSASREITITVDSMITTNQKPKENDSASNASSTHFTMVNGFGGSRIKQPTKPVCCCNHITAVIVSMTILFMFIIFGVIIFAECEDFSINFSPESLINL